MFHAQDEIDEFNKFYNLSQKPPVEQIQELTEALKRANSLIRQYDAALVFMKDEYVKIGGKTFWQTTLDKPITEMTKTEIIERNKSVSASPYVKNAEAEPQLDFDKQAQIMREAALYRGPEKMENPHVVVAKMIVQAEIDRLTANTP